jgi:CheY-like chemotaxis protein
MDVQMPHLDGCGAVAQLRARGYSRPIIALTAHALPEERDRCFASGFNAHVTKPIDMNLLLEKIRTLVSRQATESGGQQERSLL